MVICSSPELAKGTSVWEKRSADTDGVGAGSLEIGANLERRQVDFVQRNCILAI
jgi:hypothetical protein